MIVESEKELARTSSRSCTDHQLKFLAPKEAVHYLGSDFFLLSQLINIIFSLPLANTFRASQPGEVELPSLLCSAFVLLSEGLQREGLISK